MTTELVRVHGMTKTYGSVTALNNVDFTLRSGEIHGLIGENGSGKSTLTSILAGMQQPDNGEMIFKGETWRPSTMLEGINGGIGMIVQESGVIPNISVAENIFLGETGQFKKGFFVNKTKMFIAAKEALLNIGVEGISSGQPTGSLDFQNRKMVEIARVHMKQPDVLIVDETTTALSHSGRTILYDLMNKIKLSGKSIIFITHDLDEIMEVCDNLTVLRDGNIIRTFTKDEFEAGVIRESLIGRELQGDYYRTDMDGSVLGEVVLEANNLSISGELKDLSLKLHKGEILGIGGLSNCGMHTLGKVLFGAVKPERGSVIVNGQPVKNENVAMQHAMGYVSKDRDTESLSLTADILDNIAIAGLDRIAGKGRLKKLAIFPGAESSYVDQQIGALSIKCSNRNQMVSQLSGGNKQKVVFGKWIGFGSKILILDCPTRGVDIGVKQAMYQLITQLKNQGRSVVLISEELAELIGMSDRIIMMKDGKATCEFNRSEELNESDLIHYMI